MLGSKEELPPLATSGLRERKTMDYQPSLSIKADHTFNPITFTKPTYCDLCHQFIWGMVNQGFSCYGCGLNSHKKCCSQISSVCNTENGAYQRNARSSLDSARPSSIRPGSIRSLARSTSISSGERSGELEPKKSSLVTELFAETQVQARKLGNTYIDANPSLSMSLILKANNRFNCRQEPLIYIEETIIKLITWDSVPNTLIFLLCYIIICMLLINS